MDVDHHNRHATHVFGLLQPTSYESYCSQEHQADETKATEWKLELELRRIL